jgi:hypothetical protein
MPRVAVLQVCSVGGCGGVLGCHCAKGASARVGSGVITFPFSVQQVPDHCVLRGSYSGGDRWLVLVTVVSEITITTMGEEKLKVAVALHGSWGNTPVWTGSCVRACLQCSVPAVLKSSQENEVGINRIMMREKKGHLPGGRLQRGGGVGDLFSRPGKGNIPSRVQAIVSSPAFPTLLAAAVQSSTRQDFSFEPLPTGQVCCAVLRCVVLQRAHVASVVLVVATECWPKQPEGSMY